MSHINVPFFPVLFKYVLYESQQVCQFFHNKDFLDNFQHCSCFGVFTLSHFLVTAFLLAASNTLVRYRSSFITTFYSQDTSLDRYLGFHIPRHFLQQSCLYILICVQCTSKGNLHTPLMSVDKCISNCYSAFLSISSTHLNIIFSIHV